MGVNVWLSGHSFFFFSLSFLYYKMEIGTVIYQDTVIYQCEAIFELDFVNNLDFWSQKYSLSFRYTTHGMP